MTQTDPRDTATLIAHVNERFHEGHRRDLPSLQALARPVNRALADHLEAMTRALETHMFKEEMRLFPMMEQGGNTLIGLLMQDLDAEHRAHEASLAVLQDLMAAQPLPADLQRGLLHFIDELQQHVQIEDEVLFPRFAFSDAARPAS